MAKLAEHANPDCLLGLVQRGRGEGDLWALSASKAETWQVLVDCICNDPRLDSQVENRAEYYASIAMEVGLDLAPLAQHLSEHDDTDQTGWNTPLTVGTLGELAKRRYRDASKILCDYVTWGQWWEWELDALTSISDSEIQNKVAGAIEQRFPSDEELRKTLECSYLDAESWATLAKQSKRIGKFTNNLQKKEGEALFETSAIDLTSLTAKELLELANSRNRHKLREAIAQLVTSSEVELLMENISLEKPYVADVALAGLAALAPASAFGRLQQFWSANPDMPGFLRHRIVEVMVSLPHDLTLPLARQRVFHESWHERHLAERLFKIHAQLEDIPVLRAALKQALQNDEEFCYRLCALVDAFSHLPGAGLVPELLDVFVQFRYSYGRGRAAKGMNVTSPDLFRERFAFECMWDCEDGTRALGAKFVPLGDKAAGRLHDLALDLWEEKDVREGAAMRMV